MRLSEGQKQRLEITRTVRVINKLLSAEPNPMERAYHLAPHPEQLHESVRTVYTTPSNVRKRFITASVGPFMITLLSPPRTAASEINIRSDRRVSELVFQEEQNSTKIFPIELCVELVHHSLHTFGYVISRGNVFAVAPPERQQVDFDTRSDSVTPEVVFVHKAFRKEALAVARLAKKTLISYQRTQRHE